MHSQDLRRYRRENDTRGHARGTYVSGEYEEEEESYEEEEEDDLTSSDSDEQEDLYETSVVSQSNSPRPRKRYLERSSIRDDKRSEFARAAPSTPKNSFAWSLICVLLALAAVGVFVYRSHAQLGGGEDRTVRSQLKEQARMLDQVLNESIEKVRARFKNQRTDIWDDILSRMYDVVIYPEKPSIITLFANEPVTMNCLAQLLGEISSVILGSNDFLTLRPQDFGNDLGEVIYNLKIRISQKRAVVIQDLLSVNTEALKAFHNLCDRENPLVNRTIYIITMLVDGYKPWQNELQFVERKLNDRLSREIEKDILDPLITRITDGAIISIQPELTASKCSFPLP